MDRTLLPEATPVAIPKAVYPTDCAYRFREDQRRVLQAHPEWLNLNSNDAGSLAGKRTCMVERAVLSLLCTEAAYREDTAGDVIDKPAFNESYMHDRPEPKAEPAPRPAPHLYAVPAITSPKVEHSPPCTTAAVIAIWDSYPELHKAGGLVPNRILAIRGDQLTFRKACEYAAKKLASGASVGSPAGLVHNTFKTMVARK